MWKHATGLSWSLPLDSIERKNVGAEEATVVEKAVEKSEKLQSNVAVYLVNFL